MTLNLTTNEIKNGEVIVTTKIVSKSTKDTVKKRREKLVKTLLKSKYRQGRGALCSVRNKSYSYCCLGVACRIYEEETGKKISEINDYDNVLFDNQVGILPGEVQKYFGFKTECGDFNKAVKGEDKFGNKEECTSLVGLNDSLEWDFKKIGNFIKSNPKGLFGKAK